MKVLAALLLPVILVACGGGAEPTAAPPTPTAEPQVEDSDAFHDTKDPELAGVCMKASALINTSDPGTVPKKRATPLANEAFFIDDSVEVTSAFSNLINVYVYDDGTSSEEDVRSQLEAICG